MKVSATERFAIIPEWVLFADISASALRVFAVLHRFADKSTGRGHPSRNTLAEKARINIKTVDRSIAELVAIGAVQVKNRKRKGTNEYTSNEYLIVMSPPSDNFGATGGDKNGAETIVSMNESQELPTSTEVEVAVISPVDQIAKTWWDSRPKKPLGKKAWWSLRAVIQAALDRDYTAQEITDALNRYGTIPSLPALDRELQRIRPQTKWATQMNEIGNYLANRTHNPFDPPTQGELNP